MNDKDLSEKVKTGVPEAVWKIGKQANEQLYKSMGYDPCSKCGSYNFYTDDCDPSLPDGWGLIHEPHSTTIIRRTTCLDCGTNYEKRVLRSEAGVLRW